jgi:aminopeptidase N
MKAGTPQTVLLKDYKAPAFFVEEIDLRFDLHEDHTDVFSKVHFRKNAKSTDADLVLDGEKLELLSIHLNGKELGKSEYSVSESELKIRNAPTEFRLEIATRIKPQENLTLEGLYKSKGMFCTQCEAQGFRKITYYPDRPDVMAIFTTTIEADKKKYPILLSNGNLIEKKELENGRHSAKWKDPFRKPAYLYALVAGNLGKVEDHFTTKSGRNVKLEIFVDLGNEDRTQHAMDSLKKSMKWDEEVYGLEYDLDIFMIVAVDDFNMGAMENKGLNIFNSSLVLAKPETATDTDYENIEAVVAHEYFHNWTGNRITCRDWFQLSLKEGLTVYRDQEFSSDVTSRAVCRIDNVSRLRQFQFAEDAGPMAHPIRPSSYIEINNFYTATVYEKGSEVIRMIATILGKDGFRKGMDKYFELFDGQAVTTEDFVHSMEIANGVDLKQFRETWYEQAGTPEVKVQASFSNGKAKIEFTQTCAPTPGQEVKRPFHIPFAMALLDQSGNLQKESLLHLKKEKETFEFEVKEKPVLSLLRNFSAPVKVKAEQSDHDLMLLLAKDSDSFARWEAGQTLFLKEIQKLVSAFQAGSPLQVNEPLVFTMGKIAADSTIDPALRAQLLDIPEEGYLGQQMPVILVDAVHAAREFLEKSIARGNEAVFRKIYSEMENSGAYRYHPLDVGKRSLRKALLAYLTNTGKAEHAQEALRLCKNSNNLTEELSGLIALIHHEGSERDQAFDHFYQKWNKDSLVMNKWLMSQSVSSVKGGLERLKRIMKDPVFNINNPNKVYSLLVAFGRMNLTQFHAEDGSAYKFFADLVMDIDARNPSVASRMVSLFNQWKRFDPKRQALMKAELERIVAKAGISNGVFEIASKALK